MNSYTLVGAAAVVGAIAMTSATAVAAPIAWTTPSGDAGGIQYSNGQTNPIPGPGPYFGSPTAAPTENKFAWNPLSTFDVTATDSVASKSDTVSFDVIEDGIDVTRVRAVLRGDYSILGDGVASANVTGTLTITYTLPAPGAPSSPMTFTDYDTNVPINFPVTGDSEGTFVGAAEVVLPSGVTNFNVSFNSLISASADDEAVVDIFNQTLNIYVPEPASVATLAALSAGVLLRRRRRD